MTMSDIINAKQLMAVADRLYSLPEERVVHASGDDLAEFLERKPDQSVALEDLKFNMHYSRGTFHECGTVCCVLGWGNLLFPNDFEGDGPYLWLFSSAWANRPWGEADGAKAAAHRIWYWIAQGCFGPLDSSKFEGYLSESGWARFVKEWPILECRRLAQERVHD